MRQVDALLEEYGESHQNSTNKANKGNERAVEVVVKLPAILEIFEDL